MAKAILELQCLNLNKGQILPFYFLLNSLICLAFLSTICYNIHDMILSIAKGEKYG